jgi:hypothetical protein
MEAVFSAANKKPTNLLQQLCRFEINNGTKGAQIGIPNSPKKRKNMQVSIPIGSNRTK